MTRATRAQAVALIVLRTLVGWHVLYEGYYKLLLPAWSRGGSPLEPWSAAGYLRGASGPLAVWFRALGESALLPWIDTAIPAALVLSGLSLMLGLFTQAGAWCALALLMGFCAAQIPTGGPSRRERKAPTCWSTRRSSSGRRCS